MLADHFAGTTAQDAGGDGTQESGGEAQTGGGGAQEKRGGRGEEEVGLLFCIVLDRKWSLSVFLFMM